MPVWPSPQIRRRYVDPSVGYDSRTMPVRLLVVLTAALLLFLPGPAAEGSIAPIATAPNLKVAFIGDSGYGPDFQAVLDLIAAEGADIVLHQGDFDYADDPDGFFGTIDAVLGPSFPYLAAVGNHDAASWPEGCGDPDGCYASFLKQRMATTDITPDGPNLNDQMYAADFQGLSMIFVGENNADTGDCQSNPIGYACYIRYRLQTDQHIWRICSWHKNQTAMQVGAKTDEMGWAVYENCLNLSAIIATAHEHSYERTKTLTSMKNQTVDLTQHPPAGGVPGNSDALIVKPGASFAFVSALGGFSMRDQQRCLPATYPYGCNYEWASIYTQNQTNTVSHFGALFIEFHVDGDPYKARGYFKTTTGEVIDSFEITADFQDADGDAIQDGIDNCPSSPNADQKNRDFDAFGDVCDACPAIAMSPCTATVPTKLDPSFGWLGRVLKDVAGGQYEDEPYTLIMQPDGKFVMPGKAFNAATGDYDFIVLRFNANGTVDTSFGTDGYTFADIQGGRDEALGLVMQPDGKLVAAGFGRDPVSGLDDIALARFNPDGSLDASFGINGVVITDFSGTTEQALGLVIQGDGRLVAGGYVQSLPTGSDFALARYLPDGTLDASYSDDGLVTTDFGGSDVIFRLAIQPDGKVVAVGWRQDATSGADMDFAVARYNVDGSPDTGFATNGKAVTDILGGTDLAMSVLVDDDARILVGGLAETSPRSYDFALVRYNSNGAVDQTFATSGKPGVVTSDFFQGQDHILALAVQPDGKILAAGHARHPTRGYDSALARYNADGTADTSFGYGGLFTADFFGGSDGIHGIVLQDDGKAVLAGDAYNAFTRGDDFGLSRYLIADPSWISGVVSDLPGSAFASPTARNDTAAALSAIQADLSSGGVASAISRLNALRAHLDGCPAAADADDWIVECSAQVLVRKLVDQVRTKLGG